MSNILDSAIARFEMIRNQSGEFIFFEDLPRKDFPQTAPAKIEQPMASEVEAKPKIAATPEFKPIEKVEKAMPKPKIEVARASEAVVPGSVDATWKDSVSLEELKSKISSCLNCPLGSTRKSFVFGEGNPNADIMIIGEAPGADEDEQGMPFVGRAGQLLTKILEAINFSREDVFIGNIIKCRPPANRRPTTQEINECEPYLLKQIELIKPKFILALGLTAADTLFKKAHKMADVRGNLFDYHGIKTMITYHPAALLRNPNWKKSVWEDVQLLRKLYDEYKS